MRTLHRLLALLPLVLLPASLARAQEQDIEAVSLESLLDVPVSAAARYEQTAREAPASVTVIAASDIARYGYRTLAEALGSVPGFYTSYDRSYASVGVRGFSRPSDYNNRVLLLIDGYAANEYTFGSAPVGTALGLDLGAVERIEVVRGPGSALYGTSAMLAVVNVVTKEAGALDGLRARAEAGSFGRREGAASYGKAFSNGAQVSLSGLFGDVRGRDLYFEDEADPEAGTGLARGKDGDRYYGLAGTATYGRLTLSTRLTSRKKGIPGGAWSTFVGSEAWTLDGRAFAGLRYEHALGTGKALSLRGHFDRYVYRGAYPYLDVDEAGRYTGDVVGAADNATTRRLGGEAQFRWDTGPGNRLVLGLELQRHLRNSYFYRDDYGVYTDFDVPSSLFSLYAQDAYQLSRRLAVTLGLRYYYSTTAGSAAAPRAALVFAPSERSAVKLLYGEAFRAPTSFELHYDDPISGYVSNPHLDTERIRTVELVWEQAFSRTLSGSASLYRYGMRGLIDQVDLQEDLDLAARATESTDSLYQYQNVGRAVAHGLEVALQARFGPALRGYASYALQHAHGADGDGTLSNSPAHLAKGGVAFPLLGGWSAATELRYESGRRTVGGTTTSPFVLADLSVRTARFANRLRVSGSVYNLFGTSYALPGSHEHRQDAVAQNGRGFAIGARYRF